MTLGVETIPCLSDNYAFIVTSDTDASVMVVDVPEWDPLDQALKARGLIPSHVLLTHHHWDHVDGLADLKAAHPDVKVIGANADMHRLPPLDIAVTEGEQIEFGGEKGEVIDVSGHTIGHIAVHFPASNALFTADSLMALGCGRVFEGTKQQMHESLQKLVGLPGDTIVYSGHEYTQSNARFALTVDPENPALISRAEEVESARAQGRPTVPSTLAEELATNPFLRAHDPAIRRHLGLEAASDAEVFTEIRTRKDNF